MYIDNLDEDNKIHFIKHFYIDLRPVFLKPKLEKITGVYNQFQRKFQILQDKDGFSWFHYANFMKILNDIYGEDIEHQLEIRKTIDFLFYETKHYIQILLVVYVFGFFIPFILQMLFMSDGNSVIVLNCICLLTQCLFMSIEFL